MSGSSRFLRRIAVCAAALGVLMALGAGSASAASWSSGYPVVASGSMTFERSDGAVAPVTCKVEDTWTASTRSLNWRCPGKTIVGEAMVNPGWAEIEGVGKPIIAGVNFGPTENPWSSSYWYQPALNGSVVNGNASEPTRVSFANQSWGWTYTGNAGEIANLSATGSFKVTTPSGGLTTIVK